MQLVMNNKRLLSHTIDKQLNIIKNQKRLLRVRKMARRKENLFSNKTEGLTKILESSLSQGNSPRQVHAYQEHRTEMLDSQGATPDCTNMKAKIQCC